MNVRGFVVGYCYVGFKDILTSRVAPKPLASVRSPAGVKG